MSKLTSLGSAILVIALAPAAPVRGQQTQSWDFAGIDRIEIDGVSGNLAVLAGSGSAVNLQLGHEVRLADAFHAEVDKSGGTLRVREVWSGRNSSGRVTWTLAIPADAEITISFDTASGDLEASGVSARFRLDTASGDLRLSDMTIADGSSFDTASGDLILTDVVVGEDVDMDTASGDVELTQVQAGPGFDASTASGNVRIEQSEGVLEGSSASGHVRVVDSRLTGPSEFSSASGDVAIELSSPLQQSLRASSASGDVELEAPFGADFTLVMSRRKDRGRIDSPFDPTSEEEFTRNDRVYVRQTVVRGSGGPRIELSTASGSVRVRSR
jgi:DUF4097 and DUF4098 domain-containing protein YvlB